ncbi:MAG: hypothetical protein MUF15_02150 [Acidobacteria bacterium]|jgi:hypothetical protein|nr:hypothetical protein [Acidobacteriota bacterium]
MRLINEKDDDMLKAIKLSIKMTGKDKMSEHFKRKIEAGENAVDSWFYYGLNAWEMMNVSSQAQKKHEYLVEALKGFGEAVSIEELHWPALLLRSLIRTMMSGDEVDEMTVYLLSGDYSLEDALTDIEKLLEFQKKTKPEPYFFITFAFLANRMLELDKFTEVERYIKEGLVSIPAGRVRYLGSILYIPVIMLYNKLLQLKHIPQALEVKKRYDILFPRQSIN